MYLKSINTIKDKKIICIFAHPDDEAFGPAGTILKLAKNNDIQIICVTDGKSPGTRIKNLAETRKGEFEKSCQTLGVTKTHHLNYKDGEVCNANYHEIAENIEKIFDTEEPDILITFDPKGLTGHLDHIGICMITTFVFKKRPEIKNLLYYCGSKHFSDLIPSYFVYLPKGYKRNEVDHVVDVSDVWEEKTNAIKCHISQKGDIERYLSLCQILPKEEYFLEFNR